MDNLKPLKATRENQNRNNAQMQLNFSKLEDECVSNVLQAA